MCWGSLFAPLRGSRRRCLLGLYSALLSTGLLSASVSQAQDSLIVYGGVGFVKGAWQPETSKILTAEQGGLLKLRRDLGIAVESHAISKQFGWSSAKLAVSSQDVAAAIKKKNPDWTSPYPDVSDMLDHFDTVYALVVIPTYEARIFSSGGSSNIAVDNEHLLVWTSAVLVELGSGEVKLSATAAAEFVAQSDAGKTGIKDLSRQFKTLLERSSFQALDRLSGLSSSHSPADDFPVMFTGAIVADNAARNFYRFGAPESRKNVCKLSPECEHEDCGRVIALLANGVAEVMTSMNVPVLPPLNLNAWGERATDRVALNLTLPRGARHFEDSITVAVGADSADQKLVTVVQQLTFKDSDGSSKYLKNRHYMAKVRVHGFETDPDNCAALLSKPVKTKPAFAKFSVPLVEGAPDHNDLHRARLLMALYKSLTEVKVDVFK